MKSTILNKRRRSQGTSIIPVLVLSALVAIIAAPTLFQLQMNQRMRANDLFRMQIYQTTNSELFEKYRIYKRDRDDLNKAMLEDKQTNDISSAEISNIASVEYMGNRQNCSGYSDGYQCEIFTITKELKETSTRARSQQRMFVDAPVVK